MPSSALLAAGALVWSCTVYDSDLLPAGGGPSGAGNDTGAGGNKGGATTNAGNSAMPSAGKASSGGTESGEGGAPGMTSGGAGAVASEGGAGNEAGEASTGSGGAVNAGSGGVAGGAGKAGSGGTGGSAPVVACADHPISDKTTWVATASSSSEGNGMETDGLFNPPEHMIDGKFGERWSSGKPQLGDEWIQIDFGVVVNLSSVTLNVNNDTGDYPRKYAVRVSNKSQDFAAPVRASGDGMPGNLVVSLASPVTGRYLTVRQTGMNEVNVTAWWTIAEVLVSCAD